MAKMDQLIRPAELKGKSRRERKKHETRWRIFDAAVKLMRERGFDHVSIEEISEEADVARATFFQHFSNKAALMRVFSEMTVEEVKDALRGVEVTNREKLTIVNATLRRATQAARDKHVEREFNLDRRRHRLDDLSSGCLSRLRESLQAGVSSCGGFLA